MSSDDSNNVIEPEVLPPDDENVRSTKPPRFTPERKAQIVNSLCAGLLLDIVDFATLNPAIPVLNLGLGALVGWYVCTTLKIPMPQRIWWIGMAALYCAAPRTHFFPAATLIIMMRAFHRK